MDERLKLMMWLNTVVYAAFAVSAWFFLPTWESLFEGMEVPLNPGARFFFFVYPWAFVIPVVLVSGIFFFDRKPPTDRVTGVWKVINIVLLGIGVLLPPAVIYSMYAVVFAAGNVS